jgi:hypothetical protein
MASFAIVERSLAIEEKMANLLMKRIRTANL